MVNLPWYGVVGGVFMSWRFCLTSRVYLRYAGSSARVFGVVLGRFEGGYLGFEPSFVAGFPPMAMVNLRKVVDGVSLQGWPGGDELQAEWWPIVNPVGVHP